VVPDANRRNWEKNMQLMTTKRKGRNEKEISNIKGEQVRLEPMNLREQYILFLVTLPSMKNY